MQSYRCGSIGIPKPRRSAAKTILTWRAVRARCNDDQRIISDDYYHIRVGSLQRFVPVKGIHRERATSRIRIYVVQKFGRGGVHRGSSITQGWGRILKARSAREINELTCRETGSEYSPRNSRVSRTIIRQTEVREKSLSPPAADAEDRHAPAANLASGLASPLDYRVTQKFFLEPRATMGGDLSTQSRCG